MKSYKKAQRTVTVLSLLKQASYIHLVLSALLVSILLTGTATAKVKKSFFAGGKPNTQAPGHLVENHHVAPPTVHKLSSPWRGEDDHFGRAIVIQDDTIWVGAPGDDTAGQDVGAVYGFYRDGREWRLGEILLPSDPLTGQAFGYSLALDHDDPGTLVVGSPGDFENNPTAAGAVYTFVRNHLSEWTEENKFLVYSILPVVSASGFGIAVDIDESTLIIGAPLEDNLSAARIGSAYIYERDINGNWQFEEHLIPDLAPSDSLFGSSVAVDGDKALVGAPYGAEMLIPGSAYAYLRAGNGWFQIQHIQDDSQAGKDRFGTCVGLEGDLVVVGSPRDAIEPDGAILPYGKVVAYRHVYETKAELGGWLSVQEFFGPSPTIEDRFGGQVVLKDGRLLVSASNQSGRGAAHLYNYNFVENQVELLLTIAAPQEEDVELYGGSLAMDGDTLVVGACLSDGINVNEGAVFIYEL